MKRSELQSLQNQHGAVAIIVAICLIVFIGFSALAIDVGHLYVARNELQNAADAGALAGAQSLFCKEGDACSLGDINPLANVFAEQAAKRNQSEKTAVEIKEIQRGHWSFATKTFTPNESLTQTELWDVSFAELDANPAFINAVRVVTQRNETPVSLSFGRMFMENPGMQAEAVAYIGFAGTLEPFSVDQPIAICKEAITTPDGKYSCNMGRMINSGNNSNTANTGAWTNFTQPCKTANTDNVKPLVCGDGNPEPLAFQVGMGTTNGELQAVFGNPADKKSMYSCWWTNSDHGTRPWRVRLPVISCPDPSISNCAPLLSAVEVNILWMQIQANDCYRPEIGVPLGETKNYPTKMAGIEGTDYGPWTTPIVAPATQDDVRRIWESFFSHFHIRNVAGPATCEQKTIYFLPDCTPHEPTGTTGGINTGILAKIPVLVN